MYLVMCDNDFTTIRLSWCLCHDTIIITIVNLNDKMQNLLILYEQRHTKIEQIIVQYSENNMWST